MIKIPSCTIYYILSLHKIMDTLFKRDCRKFIERIKKNIIILNIDKGSDFMRKKAVPAGIEDWDCISWERSESCL